jgi:hypothetical protein
MKWCTDRESSRKLEKLEDKINDLERTLIETRGYLIETRATLLEHIKISRPDSAATSTGNSGGGQ